METVVTGTVPIYSLLSVSLFWLSLLVRLR